jgi:hypothetical protein
MLQTKNRIYQHPVLRNGSKDYNDEFIFESSFVAEIVGDDFKDTIKVSYILQIRCKTLLDLVKNRSAAFFISFYSSETLFKLFVRIDELEGEVLLPKGKVLGNLEIQPFIVAINPIMKFTPLGINEEYGISTFDIDAGAPLAVGERDVFPISFIRRSYKDLVRVQTSLELDKNEYEISLSSNVITINMGINVRQAWELMSSDSTIRPFLFLSIYKDTFVEALTALREGDDVEEFAWAKKLIETFEKVGLDLSDEDDFSKLNRAVLRLLGKQGIEKVISLVN